MDFELRILRILRLGLSWSALAVDENDGARILWKRTLRILRIGLSWSATAVHEDDG